MSKKIKTNKNMKKAVENTPVLFRNIYSKNGYIYKTHDNGKEILLGKDIVLEAVKKNIDTGEIKMELSTIHNGDKKVVQISRNDLRNSQIINLLGFGFDIFETTSKHVIEHIHNQEHSCKTNNIHSNVGFGQYNDNIVFKHYRAIGVSSDYSGRLKIEPKGTFEAWEQLVKNKVIGHTPLELALVLGFSSAVIGLIGKDTSLDSLFVHIYNDSTKGKTTALMLALSVFGCPDPKSKESLANTWSATENYLVSLLAGNYGLPIGLDEASMFSNKDFSNMIYRLASNKGKGRLNKESFLKETDEWITTLISTGEFSLLSNSNKNRGLYMRVIELGNILWTPDAKTSETIKETVLQNYGHAGIKFANHLLSTGKENITQLWNDWKLKIREEMLKHDSNPFIDRISEKLAVIMVTAEIIKDLFGFKINISEILNLLIKCECEQTEDSDIGLEAYEYFKQQYIINKKHFIDNIATPNRFNSYNEHHKESQDIWGTISNHTSQCKVISIIKSKLEPLLKDNGFNDTTVILKSWKEKGLLDCEKDRLTRKRKILKNDMPVIVYSILIKDDEASNEDADTYLIPKRKKVGK